MGRKVNPKGMRLGVTSSWDNLSGTQLDHELLKVREYMNTVLEENGYLVGETNYHISKYKLVMHITISSLDIKKVMTQEKWKKLQEDCEKLIKQSNRVDITNMKIEMICHYVSWERFDTKLITKWLVKELEKGGQIPELRDILVDWYKDSKYIGMKVKISGRINGVEMAQIENFSFGKVTTQTLKYKVDFYQQQAFTISGVLGVSVWLVETNIKEKEKNVTT